MGGWEDGRMRRRIRGEEGDEECEEKREKKGKEENAAIMTS